MSTYIDLKKKYEYEKKWSYKMIQEDGVCSTMPDNTMNSGTCGTFAQNKKMRNNSTLSEELQNLIDKM